LFQAADTREVAGKFTCRHRGREAETALVPADRR
jgi:hypothetical protein